MTNKQSLIETTRLGEEVFANNQLVYRSAGMDIPGEIEVIMRSKKNGKPIITRSKENNTLMVNGAVYAGEKFNAMRSTYKPSPVDVELGIHTLTDIVVDTATLKNELICGIMVGNGGALDTGNTVNKVNRASTTVPSPIPFRVVPVTADLTSTVRQKYFLRIIKNGYAYYYGKKFDIDRNFVVEYEDGTTVPVGGTIDTTKFIKVYVEFVITIEATDIREYFKITQGSTVHSLINSIGLVTGYPGLALDGQAEYFNVRAMTTANMSNRELKNSENTITFRYKQYIQ